MRDSSTGNSLYSDNFADERRLREVEKYGPRFPLSEMAAHPHVYTKHSIPITYGQFSEPTQEII